MKRVKSLLITIMTLVFLFVGLTAALYVISEISIRGEQGKISFIGVAPLTVSSDSMIPTFQTGDMVFIKRVDVQDLKVGDVICYHTEAGSAEELNAHRIVSVSENSGKCCFATKGDANAQLDQNAVRPEAIVGKYIGKIEGAGAVFDRFHGNVLYLMLAASPMFLVLGWQVHSMKKELQKVRQLNAEEMALRQQYGEQAKQSEPFAKK